MRSSLIVIFVLYAASIAVGQGDKPRQDGNELLLSCQSVVDSMSDGSLKGNAYDRGFCVGLVEGIAYASSTVCVPKGVTIGQEVRVVAKYLNDHPEQLNHDERILTDAALSNAFPCKKK